MVRVATAVLLALAAGAARADGPPSTAQRDRDLSNGYSELYEAVSGLRWLDEALIVKFESEETNRTLSDLARDAAQLKDELEKMAQQYPSISLHDDGLPEIEKRKRKLVEHDRLKSLAPVTGAKGADFERTLLLSQSGALNQLRFLAQALADTEQGSPRHAWIVGVRDRLDRHYVATVALLDRRFFRAPAHSPTGAAGQGRKGSAPPD